MAVSRCGTSPPARRSTCTYLRWAAEPPLMKEYHGDCRKSFDRRRRARCAGKLSPHSEPRALSLSDRKRSGSRARRDSAGTPWVDPHGSADADFGRHRSADGREAIRSCRAGRAVDGSCHRADCGDLDAVRGVRLHHQAVYERGSRTGGAPRVRRGRPGREGGAGGERGGKRGRKDWPVNRGSPAMRDWRG